MKLKSLFMAVAVASLCLQSVAAQPSKRDENVEFRRHWNMQLQGGAGYTLGETGFGDLLSPSAALSASYVFHPAWSLRLGLGGWQGRGAWVTPYEKYSFGHMQLNADIKLDLCSLIGGYDHCRTCSVYVLVGVAGVLGFGNDDAVAMAARGVDLDYVWDGTKPFAAGRMGLGVDFRVSDRVSLNVEANANVLSDHFNSKRADNADWHFNALAGVSIRLGKSYARRAAAAYVEPANIPAQEDKPEQVQVAEPEMTDPVAESTVEQPAAATEAETERYGSNIFFEINSAVIRAAEMSKIDELAEWLAGDVSRTLVVVGYADRQTGNAQYNDALSAKRAANVARALIDRGVAADRMTVDHKGDREQPFATASENRVVICTAE